MFYLYTFQETINNMCFYLLEATAKRELSTDGFYIFTPVVIPDATWPIAKAVLIPAHRLVSIERYDVNPVALFPDPDDLIPVT